ncbi:hypothetical protein OEZ71_14145 [Defluviimonas sp. WL0050]|uniref:Uncharacterized protein n=1 Tax=Albidovulum litorale TaxID=2984134 RepID=A0ABT2ZQJ9_9RHOB|nr:hypothetical protein [Defluviimonas sp. WL0050]MCV2873437.1 hypothetical protein [Defluviimonas sp. WL0050]
MTDFIFVAALYYACDQAAIQNRLSARDILRCSRVYETVKVHFLSDEERQALPTLAPRDHALTMQTAYLRFKDWEKDNPDLVASLKAEAFAAVY